MRIKPYPFAVNPHFKHWLPLTRTPGSWLVYTPGKKLKVIYLQPRDYWHVVPDAPAGYWVEQLLHENIKAREALRHMGPAAVPALADLVNRRSSRLWTQDRKSTRLNSSHSKQSRMPSSA